MSTTALGQELTVREAAQRVHRAEETIGRCIWTGQLPARKLDNGYQVHERDRPARRYDNYPIYGMPYMSARAQPVPSPSLFTKGL